MSLEDGRAAFLTSAQMVLEGVFPGVLTVAGGSALACARSAEVFDDKVATGGFELEEDVSVRVRVALLESKPAQGTKADLDGTGLRVASVHLEPGDVAWLIRLEQE
tara:strand:+ start:14 stop:331 length:318 start_codon:yes stop_codon:yes gene_type:complete